MTSNIAVFASDIDYKSSETWFVKIGTAVVRRFRCDGDEDIPRGMFRTRLRLAHADAYGRKGCKANVNIR